VSRTTLLLSAVILIISGCSNSNPGSEQSSTQASSLENGLSDDATDNNTNGPDDLTELAQSEVTEQGVLHANNATATIFQALEVLSGRAYDQRLTRFAYTKPVAFDELSFLGTQIRYLPQECQNAGVVAQALPQSNDNFISDSFYTDCLIGADVLNGRVIFDQSESSTEYKRTFSDNFSIGFAPSGEMQLAGSYIYQPSVTNVRNFSVSNFNYVFSYSGGSLSVNNANTERTQRLDGFSFDDSTIGYMSGSFTMLPPILNNIAVEVSTPENFINTDNVSQLSYERGQLRIDATDSSILLNADTGDWQTVNISITNPSGVVSNRIENWSTWRDALSFVPASLGQLTAAPAPDGNGTLINENTYRSVLTEVFAVFNGNSFGSEVLELPKYPVPEFQDGFLSSNAQDGLGEPVFQTCTNGGNTVLTPFKFGARQITSGWNYEFTNCQLNDNVFDGSFITRDFGNVIFRSKGLSINSSNAPLQFSGVLDYKFRANRDGGPSRMYGLDAANYISQTDGSSMALYDASFIYVATSPFSAMMSGSFTFKNDATDGFNLQVTTADPLLRMRSSDPNDFNTPITDFETGLLVVNAGNSNSLWLNPETGDPLTFSLTIFQADKEPVYLTENWQDWRSALAFDFNLIDDNTN